MADWKKEERESNFVKMSMMRGEKRGSQKWKRRRKKKSFFRRRVHFPPPIPLQFSKGGKKDLIEGGSGLFG